MIALPIEKKAKYLATLPTVSDTVGGARARELPSHLHGHSALCRASSRHSGDTWLLTVGDTDPDTLVPIYSCDVQSFGFPGFAA